ncbi:hypothetical protein ACCO45_003673 [Purpureocillium lilacinum]|uniref:Uncharacterized protein n=1 Tax=Purpureocillium lilacinum TaxID=33203 RepID=A0ACC4E3E5_PURLI
MSAPKVITLDNLSTQLQPWRPDDDSHLYAIVDMGSNGIRFSITSLAPPTTRLLLPIYSARVAISLFDALTLSPSGLVFPSETMDAVGSALSRFHQIALLHGVPRSQILILATEAMRRAANATQMLDSIAKATGGLSVQILDPSVETLFGAVMGSRSGLVAVKGGALFLDLGGGSVQMTWVDTSQAHYEFQAALAGESLPYGAAKLTRVLEEQPPEIHQAEIGTLEEGIDRIYANLCSRFPALQAIKSTHDRGEGATVDVYMCGGGFRGYGSMLMHNDSISPYPISSINSYSVPGRVFRQTSEMRRLNREYDGKIFGMSKRRRRQFPAIATVIEAFIAAVPNIGRDEHLFQGLRRIADGHDKDASFWAMYSGAICGILPTIFPIMPEPDELLSAITLHAAIEPGKSDKRDKVILSIGLASKYQGNVNPEALADEFQSALSNKGDKAQFKTSVRVTSLS